MPWLVRNSSTRLQKIQPGCVKTVTDLATGLAPFLDPHGMLRRFDLVVGPSGSNPSRTDAPAPGKVVATISRETPRAGDERSDAPVGYAIDDVATLPSSGHKPAPLQTREVVGNPAARRADGRGELHDRTFPVEQNLQHAEACGVAENAKVPRAGGQSWPRRGHDASLQC